MSLDDVQVHLVDSTEDVAALMTWLGERRPGHKIGFDTESTGLNRQTDRVRLAQVGDAKTGWAIPFEDWRGVVKEILSKWDGEYVMHNAPFDWCMMRNEGMIMPKERIHDTRQMHHPLEPTYSTALKPLATRYVDPRAGSSQKDLKDAIATYGWDGIPVTFQPYWVYAALDSVLTVQLDDVIRPRVLAECPRSYDLELGAAWITTAMEDHGALVDKTYARAALDRFRNLVDESAQWCSTHYGITPGASKDVIRILNDEGFNWSKKTAGGATALDKEILESIDHPLAKTVLQHRRLQKLSSTYLRHFIDESDGDDRIHCSINTIGARTSRMSITQPALQTLPRHSEKNMAAIMIRNCIRAAEDHTLVMCDFDQIEMRVLAYLTQDAGMTAAFLSEDDFFVEMARELFVDPTITKSDRRRQIVKNGGYAKIYGAGIPKFALTAGVSETVARDFMRQFDAKYSNVPKYVDTITKRSRETLRAEGASYVRSPLTGRKHVADRGKEYALLNYLIQGTAAEIFKTKLLELDAAGLGPYMVVPVHDEIVLEVSNHRVPEVVHTIMEIMNDIELLAPVPISASVSFGQRWGEKYDWDIERWAQSVAR